MHIRHRKKIRYILSYRNDSTPQASQPEIAIYSLNKVLFTVRLFYFIFMVPFQSVADKRKLSFSRFY